jgi:hypothetical protein
MEEKPRGVVTAQAAQPEFNCAVCKKPVDLRTAKTNERGKAVHENVISSDSPLYALPKLLTNDLHLEM